MNVEPFTVSQIRQAEDGSWIEIDATAGSTLSDLQRIDKGFRARLKITDVPPGKEFYAVFHENHPDCPHNGKDSDGRDLPNGSTYLVSKWKAVRNHAGTWEGLDQRAVTRIMQIGHSSYDYARELEQQNLLADREKKREMSERVGEMSERAAFAVRKDLGTKYRGRIFKPRDVKEAGK